MINAKKRTKYLVSITLLVLMSACDVTINEYHITNENVVDSKPQIEIKETPPILKSDLDNLYIDDSKSAHLDSCGTQFFEFESQKCFLIKFKAYPDDYAWEMLDSLTRVNENIIIQSKFDSEVYFSDNSFSEFFNSVVVYTGLSDDCISSFLLYNLTKDGCIIDKLELAKKCYWDGYYQEISSIITNDSLIEVVDKRIIGNLETKDPFENYKATTTLSFYHINNKGKFDLIASNIEEVAGYQNQFDGYFALP
ncbi:MAG: hypothetical protein HRT71_11870 [Flavobacteriales bacterium]|nr:hypothetical protein [Flavobacteriales bacterium]